MRIDYERSGGIGGFILTTQIDTASLSPDEARDLEDKVERAGFFSLPAMLPSPTRSRDRFQYVLTVEKEGRRHTIRVSEEAVPANLRFLLDDIERRCRRSGTA